MEENVSGCFFSEHSVINNVLILSRLMCNWMLLSWCCQLQDSSSDNSVMSDEAPDHTLVELLETEVRSLLTDFHSCCCLHWITNIGNDGLYGLRADCKNAAHISTQLSATQLIGELSDWFCHAAFEWAHFDLRVGFVFLQQFSCWVYLN